MSGTAAPGITLPKGGGALQGIGEKFSPDLHTGTGNFSIPIALPPGRNGFAPQLSLSYSTGSPNGPFGLGFGLSVPGVTRRTAKGVPRYRDGAADPQLHDVFILSSAEDLVPVASAEGVTRYRPRTEGLFAGIERRSAPYSYWIVSSKDGLISRYGVALPGEQDRAVVADPDDPRRIFAWRLSETVDPFGNRIEYRYLRDRDTGTRSYDQLYIEQIRYADYADGGAAKFLVTVDFEYVQRPDAFSDGRAGFEVRTRFRCTRITVSTHADAARRARTYDLVYLDQRPELASTLPRNGASLLSRVQVCGWDGDRAEMTAPIDFAYTSFEPERRRLSTIDGDELPTESFARGNLELVDLFGSGLPDIFEMSGTARYWRNRGGGRFDLPRAMASAPAGLQLSSPGVQLVDADGDGRADLVVTQGALAGYYPLRFGAEFDERSFQPYAVAPGFDLSAPDVHFVDLNGDGVTDALRDGTRFECFFSSAEGGWEETIEVERGALDEFPNVRFADPRVKWADMSGDGLQDVVLVDGGAIDYWPARGWGRWGARVLLGQPRDLPTDCDPRRVLLGDIDGDGAADLLYVEDGSVTLWINQNGQRWSDPIVIRGTPSVSDGDAVRLADLLGAGVSGLVWSADATVGGRARLFFLDFIGGLKPYLMNEMRNNMGARTRVSYASSTRYFLEDQAQPSRRWAAPLPFPVHVVSRSESIDELSGGRLTTEYAYHHGYWDGAEREFRGFGRVDQRDTETFERARDAGRAPVAETFSPPLETRTWFHQGPIGTEHSEWGEADYADEYWAGDPTMLRRGAGTESYLLSLPRRARRDALRTLRASVLRTELYALDGSPLQGRPYTVTESVHGLREELVPGATGADRARIFFPHPIAQRTTQWERGDDPMTRFAFTEDYDEYGQARQQTQIACPRGWRTTSDPSIAYLATRTRIEYAEPADPQQRHIRDRVARTTTFEITNNAARTVGNILALSDSDPAQRIIGQEVSFYDGAAFTGEAFGRVGAFGALMRTERLMLTEEIVRAAYGDGALAPPTPLPVRPAVADDAAWTAAGYPLEFRDRLAPAGTVDPTRPGLSGTPAGYGFAEGDAVHTRGYFAATARRKYDVHDDSGQPTLAGRGMITATRDALGRDATIAYDAPYTLLPIEVTDHAGLKTKAVYEYRVLQPRQVTDPNGNRTQTAFTPLGLPKESWLLGNPANVEGDRQRPGVRMEYDFLAFTRSEPSSRQPISVKTIRHIHHDTETDIALPQRDETITAVEYSDGFGRVLQTRTQGEEVRFGDPIHGGGDGVLSANQSTGAGSDVSGSTNPDAARPNVVVSGWQTYDNKGRVVEKYEPFFSSGWEHDRPGEAQRGQKVTTFYDPREQVIRTRNPDGSEQRVIYGVPSDLTRPEPFAATPWEVFTYGANDNAGRTHPAESSGYQHHWNTPVSAQIDALGRTVQTVERNGANPSTDWYASRSTYDIRGALLTVTDPVCRVAFRHVYDLADRPLRTDSVDAGVRVRMLDAAGSIIEARDSKGALVLGAYDTLNRPVRSWARDAGGQPMTLRERLVYGDGADAGVTPAEAIAANLLGKPYRHYDEAGLVTIAAYDFKGNALEKTRRVVADSSILAVFSPPPADWTVTAFRVNWEPVGATPLDPMEYQTTLAYDALNRVKTMRYPRDVEGARQTLQPRYNRAGALERVAVDATTYVERIAYNAKGQRTLIAYGNGVMTRHAYDSRTFRLARMRTERYMAPAALTYHPAGAALQDLAYRYDLAGNVLGVVDRTPGCGVLNNPEAAQAADLQLAQLLAAGDALIRRFEYDPLYRLRLATGRESNNIPVPRSWTDDPRRGFNFGNHGTPNQDNAPNLTIMYREEYAYDPAGNMVSLTHGNNAAPWVRHFGMGGRTPQQWSQEWPQHLGAPGEWTNPPANCLTHVGDNNPLVAQSHFFDADGNLVRETASRHFEWDHSDRLRVYRTQVAGAEPSVHAQYLYDAGGQRVKKLVRKQGGQYEVTVYVDAIFEHHRIVTSGTVQENNTLHVMDDQRRIALMRVGAPFLGDVSPAVNNQLADHLDSSAIVIDAAGAWINREEYFPYGETSFGSVAKKRYRFTGKERDEESGLYYHGARYYASWVGRWCNCDPLGPSAGVNVYWYANDSPLTLNDPRGTQAENVISAVEKDRNPNISIELEKKDLSIGTARYKDAKPISKNLSMKPSLPGRPDNPMPHANIEVHLYDDQGKEVAMTRRLVRYWAVMPEPGAKVEELEDKWHVRDPGATFTWDNPGSEDAPGFQGRSVDDEPFGQLQEFLAGNENVGGVYLQTWTLQDSDKIMTINTRPLKFSPEEYREVLQLIDSGDYAKSMKDKLFHMSRAETIDVTPLPKPAKPSKDAEERRQIP